VRRRGRTSAAPSAPLDQSNGQPVYIVNSTFGGPESWATAARTAAALSSIGVSYTVINSVFTTTRPPGTARTPMQPGTPGGGNGGAIANDGNEFTLTLCGTEVTDNVANEGGGGIFFVSNNRTGNLNINDSLLCNNDSLGFETAATPGIFVLASGDPSVSGSSLEDTCP
jgi:hypothetical protein